MAINPVNPTQGSHSNQNPQEAFNALAHELSHTTDQGAAKHILSQLQNLAHSDPSLTHFEGMLSRMENYLSTPRQPASISNLGNILTKEIESIGTSDAVGASKSVLMEILTDPVMLGALEGNVSMDYSQFMTDMNHLGYEVEYCYFTMGSGGPGGTAAFDAMGNVMEMFQEWGWKTPTKKFSGSMPLAQILNSNTMTKEMYDSLTLANSQVYTDPVGGSKKSNGVLYSLNKWGGNFLSELESEEPSLITTLRKRIDTLPVNPPASEMPELIASLERALGYLRPDAGSLIDRIESMTTNLTPPLYQILGGAIQFIIAVQENPTLKSNFDESPATQAYALGSMSPTKEFFFENGTNPHVDPLPTGFSMPGTFGAISILFANWLLMPSESSGNNSEILADFSQIQNLGEQEPVDWGAIQNLLLNLGALFS